MKYSKLFAGVVAALALISCSSTATDIELTKSGLNPANFKTIKDGKEIGLYTLTNANGMEACITNYGGRIVSLMVPDKDGNLRDVVLGHDSISDYYETTNNFGALIGRYGNRINHGKFTIDSVDYQLPINDFGHSLHGGPKGFHHEVWNVVNATDTTLHLSLQLPDGQDGYPGNIKVDVTYTLTSDNALDIDYKATTDKPTILNLTNHAYFNLSGDHNREIISETLWIDADGYTPIDSTFMTTGEILPVEGTPFDFTTAKAIGEGIDIDNEQIHNGRGYDHNFVLRKNRDKSRPLAIATDPETGIQLEVYSDEPGLQFYSGNFLDGTVKGKRGVAYPFRAAFCLETQHYPDSPNKPEWPSVRVDPGEIYTSHCVYKFGTTN